MRKGGGKQKGASFERTVCKALSLWLSKGKREDLLWRSAMSGGRSTVALRSNKKLGAQAGDISSIDRLSHSFIEKYMVECKTYKTLNFESLIKGKGKLLEFWKIAKREAGRYDKVPMLIGKQNIYPIVVCLDGSGLKAFKLKAKIKVIDFDLNIVLMDDFLKSDPKILRRVRL
jgi:hypothetical protein